MSAFGKFIIAIVIIVLLAAGGTIIYISYHNNNSNNTETATELFYVAAPDGTEITETYSLTLSPRQICEFTVKGDISVQVLPNVSDEDNAFEFTHNGRRKQFFAETNLINAFNVEKDGDVLKLSLKDGCVSVKSVLEKIYDGETIETPNEYESTDKPLFSLVIKENGSIVLRTIYFGIGKAVSDVKLPSKIIF